LHQPVGKVDLLASAGAIPAGWMIPSHRLVTNQQPAKTIGAPAVIWRCSG
jgi:hypothetical protein